MTVHGFEASSPRSLFGAAVLLLIASLVLGFYLVGKRPTSSESSADLVEVGAVQWRARSSDPWQTVSLPHRIDHLITNTTTTHYRIDLQQEALRSLPAAHGIWAVCVSRWSMNGRARVDGKLVMAEGRFSDPVTRNSARPVFFALPVQGEPQAPRLLDIDLVSLPSMEAGLGRVWVGSFAGAHARCEAIDSDRRLLSETLAYSLFLVGSLGAVLAWRLRDRLAFWFALACYAAAIKPLHLMVLDPPVSDWTWNLWYFAGRIVVTPVILMFCLRYLDTERPMLVYVIWQVFFLAVFVLVMTPWAYWWLWLRFVAVISILAAIAGFVMVGRHAWRHSRASAWIMLASFVYGIGTAISDYVVWIVGPQQSQQSQVFLVIPVLMIGIAALALERQAFQRARQFRLSTELTEQLGRQREELREVYERLAKERERFAAEASRRRILRDMHDSVGSRLVAATTLLSSPQIDRSQVAHSLDEALIALRSTVDALSPELQHPETLLGAFRYRIEPVLQASGIRLDWEVGELPENLNWDDNTRMHLSHALHEIVANAIRHAQATRLSVRTWIERTPRLVIQVQDNGSGFDTTATRFGNGLRGLRSRAAEMGAELHIESSPGQGVKVTLLLPLDESQGQDMSSVPAPPVG